MANFDALRPATLGTLSYICKNHVVPAELTGLWQIGNGDYADKSRLNGGNFVGNTNFSTTSGFSFPMVTSSSTIKFSCAFGNTLVTSQDWTLEYYTYGYGGFTFEMTMGPLYLQIRPASNGQDYYILTNSGTSLYTGFPVGNTQNSLGHFAYVYRSGSGLKIFRNGVVILTQTTTLSVNATTFSFAMSSGSGFSNLRVVQKALGTSTSYPVPTSLYTGYEAL